MRGSADMAGMPNIKSRLVFFDGEIVCQDRPLEMQLESTPDFSSSEMRAASGQVFGMRFGNIFSPAFLGSSSVAAFRGPDSDRRNEVYIAASQQAREIIAQGAPHFRTVLLCICPNASSEGERCMKDTVHPIIHLSVHPLIFGRVRSRSAYASGGSQFGRGQNTGLGWSDPTFAHVSVPKVIRGVAPAQLRGDRAEYLVRAAFRSGSHSGDSGDKNHTELLAAHEITGLLKVPVSLVYGHSFR